jgi:hypothetical protein
MYYCSSGTGDSKNYHNTPTFCTNYFFPMLITNADPERNPMDG